MLTTSFAFIGFGEAAQAFAQGWGEEHDLVPRAFDIKTDHGMPSIREGKWADYERWQVKGCATLAEALSNAQAIFSLVTADQALTAARQAAACIGPSAHGALYFDCNSCSPGTKRRSAELIAQAGGRYVDVAVMAPVHPLLHRVPLLVSGPHAEAALDVLGELEMNAQWVEGPIGSAAANKMVRSIMVKGLEALVAECVLAGCRAGVDGAVLDSLDATFPGFNWKSRSAYMLERVMTHGVRRAAEMREVALTVEELGLPADMSIAVARWQQRIGDLHVNTPDEDYRHRADAVLAALLPGASVAEMKELS